MYDWLQVTIRASPRAHVYRLISVTLTVTHRPGRLRDLIATAVAAANDSRKHVVAREELALLPGRWLERSVKRFS